MALQPSSPAPRISPSIISGQTGQIEVFNHYNTNEHMWAGNGERIVEQHVKFEQPFVSAPIVQVALAAIDATHEQNLRFHLRTKDVTKDGFTVEMMTWSDTRIARATASWFAFGEQVTITK